MDRRPAVLGVGIAHPDRVIFPAARATKLDLARYYDAVAGCFYLKHSKAWSPVPLRRVRIRERTKTGEDLVVDDAPGLGPGADERPRDPHLGAARGPPAGSVARLLDDPLNVVGGRRPGARPVVD
jgi:hypothetical protein